MATGLHQLSATALLDAFAAGRISVVAATRHYLDRIARSNDQLKAFTHVDAAGALAAAASSAARIDAGAPRPLEGLPIAVKANIAVAGLPLTAGVAARAGRIAAEDAAAVAALRAAGAVILGLTNMHEGALGATTDNPHFGTALNPFGHGLSPGGSSGGSGAAVAAGLCAAALGTDTLGSIRIPAAWCGIVGLKPGIGLVPLTGVVPLEAGLDCVGPMARTVPDCARLLSVLAPAGRARPLQRIARPDFGPAAPALARPVHAALGLSVSLLEGLGLEVEDRACPVDFAALRIAAFRTAARGAAQAFAADLAGPPGSVSEDFRALVAVAGRPDPALAAADARQLDTAANALQSLLAVVDALVMPTVPAAAIAQGTQPPPELADFTALANMAGLPAISLPAGWTPDGLPVAVQLVGRPGEDHALLDLAGRLESALMAWQPPAAYP